VEDIIMAKLGSGITSSSPQEVQKYEIKEEITTITKPIFEIVENPIQVVAPIYTVTHEKIKIPRPEFIEVPYDVHVDVPQYDLTEAHVNIEIINTKLEELTDKIPQIPEIKTEYKTKTSVVVALTLSLAVNAATLGALLWLLN
jgi:hypothetical protein